MTSSRSGLKFCLGKLASELLQLPSYGRTQTPRPEFKARRSAFVLVIVLVALVIGVTLLIQVASKCLINHQRSLQSVRELQSKWARISCERVVLPAADRIFDFANQSIPSGGDRRNSRALTGRNRKGSMPRISRLRERFFLGGQAVEVLLADESAKANLNLLASKGGIAEMQRATADLVPAGFARSLRPMPTAAPPWTDLGAVFDLKDLQRRHGDLRVLVEATASLSLWGVGTLNIHRAPQPVIRAVCSTVVPKGRADRLIETANESPAEVEIILQSSIKNESERDSLRGLLSDGSSTFSLWTELEKSAAGKHLALAVRSVSEEGLVSTYRFVLQ